MALSKLQMSRLLSVYGEMLTDKQREAAEMYFDCDCGLSEIGSEMGISRQGVRDAVVKAENALLKLESALHLSEFIDSLSIAIENDDLENIKKIAKRFVSKE